MKALVIKATSPEYRRLYRLLDDAGPGGRVEDAGGLLELLAHRSPGELVVIQADPVPRDMHRDRLCVPVRGGIVQVPVGEVRYFLAEHKYVWVRDAHHCLLIRDTLRSLAAEFAGRFVRIHRNALVSVRHLAGLDTGGGRCRVRLAGIDEALPVSRRRQAAVRRLVLQDVECRAARVCRQRS